MHPTRLLPLSGIGLLLLPGCASEAPCADGLDPADGEELALQLTELGYGDFENGADFSEGQQQILDTAEAWDEATTGWGADGGLDPDFAREAVFPNAWVFGGCGEAFEYRAWSWGDTVRVRAEYVAEDEICDAAFPQIDLVLVDHGGATDLGWCD